MCGEPQSLSHRLVANQGISPDHQREQVFVRVKALIPDEGRSLSRDVPDKPNARMQRVEHTVSKQQ